MLALVMQNGVLGKGARRKIAVLRPSLRAAKPPGNPERCKVTLDFFTRLRRIRNDDIVFAALPFRTPRLSPTSTRRLTSEIRRASGRGKVGQVVEITGGTV